MGQREGPKARGRTNPEEFQIRLAGKRGAPIRFHEVATQLQRAGCSLHNSQILYYSERDQQYVYAGIYAGSEKEMTVPIGTGVVRLKCRKISHSELLLPQAKEKQGSRRGNERRIGEAIELVRRWKTLQQKCDSERRPYSLEKAAEEIHISKKTLDDYLKQIQQGLAGGFDFAYFRDSLMGLLRHYNKKQFEK